MKRIILCADGTWGTPTTSTPSNVVRLLRAIASQTQSQDGHCREQVVFYDWGIGSDALSAGAALTGNGIDKNIQDCYRFLVHNYAPGDEIFLFGFSRGAYTVRSLAGLIRNSGILRSAEAGRIPAAYALYRKRGETSAPNSAKAATFRQAYAHTDRTPIHFIGVWDTVGSLGIPVPFWGSLDKRSFLFHDTALSSRVKHARHALALDERRCDFEPTLWQQPAPGQPNNGTDLKQVWFAGDHTDIGGGHADSGFADLSLAWMAAEAASCGLVLNPTAELERLLKSHARRRYTQPASLRNWASGLFVMRPKATRLVQGSVHRSAALRWQKDVAGYRRRARSLNALLKELNNDWQRVGIEG